jgi:hypothetical protein
MESIYWDADLLLLPAGTVAIAPLVGTVVVPFQEKTAKGISQQA